MKKYLPHALVLLIASSVYAFAAEMTDLDTTDGNNTNTTFGLTDNTSPSAVADRYQAYQGAVGRWYADTASNLTVTSTSSTAYSVTANRTLNTLTDGLNFIIEMTPTSGASPTLNVSSLGAKRLRSDATNDLATGAIREGEIIAVTYDATNDVWQVLSQLAVTSGISNVIEDTSPVLGGNLDLGGFTIAEMVTGTDIQVDLDLPTANEITEASVTGERVWSPKLISDAVEAHKAADVQIFTASGTWQKPVTATMLYIETWGGGGSGAARSSGVHAGGGAGGSYVWALLKADAVDASETVTIGAGGAAVSSSTNGNAGGNSTFGTTAFVTAYGGGAGGNSASGGGGGGGATAISVGGNASGDNGGASGTLGGGAGDGGVGTSDPFGAAGGGNEDNGGQSIFGGGGGGGGSNSTGGGTGGASIYGGGGGAGGETSGGVAGGTSVYGGKGGNGAIGNGSNGQDGSAPAGGGGGTANATSGAGARGEVRVTAF
jgi:hypothetical protein